MRTFLAGLGLLLPLLAWAGGTLRLPDGESAERWAPALQVAGLTVEGTAAASVELVDEGATWRVRARGADGKVREARVPAPATAEQREDVAWLAKSLLEAGSGYRTSTPIATLSDVRSVEPVGDAEGGPPDPAVPPRPVEEPHRTVAKASRFSVKPPGEPEEPSRVPSEPTRAGAEPSDSPVVPAPAPPSAPPVATAPPSAPPVATAPPPAPAAPPSDSPATAPPLAPPTPAAAPPSDHAAPSPPRRLHAWARLGASASIRPELDPAPATALAVGVGSEGGFGAALVGGVSGAADIDALGGDRAMQALDLVVLATWAPPLRVGPALALGAGGSLRRFLAGGEELRLASLPLVAAEAGVRINLRPAVDLSLGGNATFDLISTVARVGVGGADVAVSPFAFGLGAAVTVRTP